MLRMVALAAAPIAVGNRLRASQHLPRTRFQNFFRTRKPPVLIVWSANDVIFPAAGTEAYLRDNPGAELHLVDSGHFALEDRLNEIVPLMRDFLARTLLDH